MRQTKYLEWSRKTFQRPTTVPSETSAFHWYSSQTDAAANRQKHTQLLFDKDSVSDEWWGAGAVICLQQGRCNDLVKTNKLEAKDVLPNINCMQAAKRA